MRTKRLASSQLNVRDLDLLPRRDTQAQPFGDLPEGGAPALGIDLPSPPGHPLLDDHEGKKRVDTLSVICHDI